MQASQASFDPFTWTCQWLQLPLCGAAVLELLPAQCWSRAAEDSSPLRSTCSSVPWQSPAALDSDHHPLAGSHMALPEHMDRVFLSGHAIGFRHLRIRRSWCDLIMATMIVHCIHEGKCSLCKRSSPYLARVHDGLPDQPRPVWQSDSVGLVAGVEGAVQPSLASTADRESHKSSLFSPLSLIGHVTMPCHCSTIHEAAPSELWPLFSTSTESS